MAHLFNSFSATVTSHLSYVENNVSICPSTIFIGALDKELWSSFYLHLTRILNLKFKLNM